MNKLYDARTGTITNKMTIQESSALIEIWRLLDGRKNGVGFAHYSKEFYAYMEKLEQDLRKKIEGQSWA